MNAIISTAATTTKLSLMALASMIFASNSVLASHYNTRTRPCNPAAEAQMRSAIHLMKVACNKPLHVSRQLARVAEHRISVASRFVRDFGARSELYSVTQSLRHFIHHPCDPPFHVAIRQTQSAMDRERQFCAFGTPTCEPAQTQRGYRGYGMPMPQYGHERPISNRRAYETDVSASLANRWGQVWRGF
jgi:hypothetical protein